MSQREWRQTPSPNSFDLGRARARALSQVEFPGGGSGHRRWASFRQAGFSPRAGLQAFRVLSGYAYGYALAEIRGLAMESASAGAGPPPEVLEAEAARFPHLAEVIPEAGAVDHDVEFDAGLDVIITGLGIVHLGDRPD